MKQNYKSMTKLKKLDVTIMSSMNLSLLILKISFLTLFGCGVKITPDINSIWGQKDSLVLKTQKAYDNHRQTDRDYKQSSDRTYKLENKIDNIF